MPAELTASRLFFGRVLGSTTTSLDCIEEYFVAHRIQAPSRQSVPAISSGEVVMSDLDVDVQRRHRPAWMFKVVSEEKLKVVAGEPGCLTPSLTSA